MILRSLLSLSEIFLVNRFLEACLFFYPHEWASGLLLILARPNCFSLYSLEVTRKSHSDESSSFSSDAQFGVGFFSWRYPTAEKETNFNHNIKN